jgi:predicted nuclease of predicted toxin-antitoxin system
MRFLVDENMSRKWVRELKAQGHVAEHWLEVGERAAPDAVILLYAPQSCLHAILISQTFSRQLAARHQVCSS